MFASLIDFVYQEPIEHKWVESCYGINCEGYTAEPIPRRDWGGNYVGSVPYCNYYYWKQVENLTEIKELIEPDCYV